MIVYKTINRIQRNTTKPASSESVILWERQASLHTLQAAVTISGSSSMLYHLLSSPTLMTLSSLKLLKLQTDQNQFVFLMFLEPVAWYAN